MKDFYFRHPRGECKGTPQALDPNYVYRLQNCENPCYNTSKTLSKLLPLLQSKSHSHIFSCENTKENKLKLHSAFQTFHWQSHMAKQRKYLCKRKWLFILSGPLLGFFLCKCTFAMRMLDMALIVAMGSQIM